MAPTDVNDALDRVAALENELNRLKRDLLHAGKKARQVSSLFGAVQGEEVTDEMIREAKRSLFRKGQDH